jgi:hypothetical protein
LYFGGKNTPAPSNWVLQGHFFEKKLRLPAWNLKRRLWPGSFTSSFFRCPARLFPKIALSLPRKLGGDLTSTVSTQNHPSR